MQDMQNYFFDLPDEIKEYIYTIVKNSAAQTIQNIWIKSQDNKRKLIEHLICDLRIINNCDNIETNLIFSWSLPPPRPDLWYALGTVSISPNDPKTVRMLETIDNIFKGFECFINTNNKKETILNINIWNKFLFNLAEGIWGERETRNINYDKSEDLYHSLRTKTVRGAIMYENISSIRYTPPWIERYYPED